MRWCVMQSMRYKKWILAVVNEDFTAYEVTDVMSDYVEQIIQYADYLNLGREAVGLDPKMKELLDAKKRQYEKLYYVK